LYLLLNNFFGKKVQVTKEQKKRVAIFFIIGTSLFIAVFAILLGNKVLKREECFFTNFHNTSVAGLNEGASVKFQGMNIGTVSTISIDKKDTSVIKIDFCLKPGVPVKEGTVAELGNIGITGLKFLELKGGGSGKRIPINSEVPSVKSQWDKISGKASVITEKIESILNNVNKLVSDLDHKKIHKSLKNFESISSSVAVLLEDNRKSFTSITKSADSILVNADKDMKRFSSILTNVDKITADDGKINKTLTSMNGILSDIKKTVNDTKIADNSKKILTLVDSFQSTMDTVNLTLMRSQEDITTSLENFSESMSNLNEFTRIIMETPSSIISSDDRRDKK